MMKIYPHWLSNAKQHVTNDVIAGIIVGILVIPQSLGYALLAGLPPVYGLYTAIVPVLVYAWIGSSNALAVGPVAIIAMMTAQALSPFADQGQATYIALATTLSLMAGLLLLLANILKLGWIMQFLSRGVTAGFISGAAVLIFISQIKYVTGIPLTGNTLISTISGLFEHGQQLHFPTFYVGLVLFILLVINRFFLRKHLKKYIGIKKADFISRIVPLLLLIIITACSAFYDFSAMGIKTIAHIPSGLPSFAVPAFDIEKIISLLPSVALIALIGFLSSASVGQQYSRLNREAGIHDVFNPNHELKGLGWANIFGAFFQSFPIAGGFSRTAVNVDAGAKTPLAGAVAAMVMIATLIILGQLLTPLPYAMLGAGIMAAVIGLIDINTFKIALKADKADATSFMVTFLASLSMGLNIGLVTGLLFSFAALIWRSSQPHIAVVGQIGDTGHFRNINRHQVRTFDNLLIMRVDESLFFGNCDSVKTQIEQQLEHSSANHLILMLNAVNHIDLGAQEMLHELDKSLVLNGKQMHLTEVKGPVMDKIKQTPLVQNLSGQVFLSTLKAVNALNTH